MAYGCLMECIPLPVEAVNTHRDKPKVRENKDTRRFWNVYYFQNCRPDRTVHDALNDFLVEADTSKVMRTTSEIIYNSGGTKIETRDEDGNPIQRYDSMTADQSLNNICSLIQDLNSPNSE